MAVECHACDKAQRNYCLLYTSDSGVERPVAAELSYGDKKEVKKIRLPYREPFNQSVSNLSLIHI